MQFLTQTVFGKWISTFIISMVPIIELRGGLPYGIALGLPYPLALLAAVLGNVFPVPFILVYIRRLFDWARRRSKKLDALVVKLERRAHSKGRWVEKYSILGLCLLVAIPLPGTGAWTGALVATILEIPRERAIPTIVLGVCISAAIITGVTYGVKVALF